MVRFVRPTLLACLALTSAGAASAQQVFPRENVHFLVAFAPGGIGDIIARIVGQALQEKWGHTVVVDNRGGAGGNIGAGIAARADPDGYTVLLTTSAFAVNLTLYDKPGYAAGDFKTVAVLGFSPNVIIGAPTLKQNTLREVIDAAKTEPFSFGSAGIGTTPHLTGVEIFQVIGKVDMRHVPFTGAGPAVAAAMGGQVPVSVIALPAAIGQIQDHLVKGLAIANATRIPEIADVPTVTETGVGDIVDATWVGMFVPAKTPQAVIDKINVDVNAVLATEPVRKAFAGAGFYPRFDAPAAASAYVVAETAKWGSVIKAAGVKVE